METRTHASHAQRIGRTALGDVIHRAARRFGDKVAVIEGGQKISFIELDAMSNRFAHYLLAQGLRSGDRVGMLCGNSSQMLAAFIGIQKAGLVWVPINVSLAPEAIGYILEHAEIRHLVIDAELFAKPELQALLQTHRIAPLVCALNGEMLPAGITAFTASLEVQPATLPDVVIESHQLAQIMYTSGTTGRQKGVMHSHASVHAALMSNLNEVGGIQSSDTVTAFLPLFHCAQHSIVMSYLLAGASILLMRGFDTGALLERIDRHRVTVVIGLPIMYAAMLAHPARPSLDLSSLRLCVYAMAPMSKPLLTQLIAEICPNFALCSGQTEMYPATTMFKPEEQLKRFGCYWGISALVNETAIMDDDGRLLEQGQVGEIVHRGPNAMLGYYKDPEATAKAQEFGWHHTGDLGMVDQDGQLLFMDRKKDMIKTGGENVPSIKVEEVLLRHPAVLNVAVIGLPHQHWIEAITAFVALKPGAGCSEEELDQHCRAHLGGFEVPKAIVLLEALPLTSTGKIQKYLLRKNYEGYYEKQ